MNNDHQFAHPTCDISISVVWCGTPTVGISFGPIRRAAKIPGNRNRPEQFRWMESGFDTRISSLEKRQAAVCGNTKRPMTSDRGETLYTSENIWHHAIPTIRHPRPLRRVEIRPVPGKTIHDFPDEIAKIHRIISNSSQMYTDVLFLLFGWVIEELTFLYNK